MAQYDWDLLDAINRLANATEKACESMERVAAAMEKASQEGGECLPRNDLKKKLLRMFYYLPTRWGTG